MKLLMRMLHIQPVEPETIATDDLASYGTAPDQMGLRHLHRPCRIPENNRMENPHLPIRRRKRRQQWVKSHASAQRFLATHTAIYNTFNIQRHLVSRLTLRRFHGGTNQARSAAA